MSQGSIGTARLAPRRGPRYSTALAQSPLEALGATRRKMACSSQIRRFSCGRGLAAAAEASVEAARRNVRRRLWAWARKSREFTDISDGALEVRAFECFLVSRGSKNTWPEVEAVEKGERSTLAVGVRASIRGPSGVSTLVRQRPTSTTPMLWWLPLVMGGAATFLLCFFGWRRRLRFLCCTRARK